jgi:hypothetical protein
MKNIMGTKKMGRKKPPKNPNVANIMNSPTLFINNLKRSKQFLRKKIWVLGLR